MALIVLPDGTQISGSVGGVTYGHNRYGAYKRARSVPVNPSSGRQSSIRTAFGVASELWRQITGTQRAAWKSYAETLSRLNKLGQPISLSGQAAFVQNLSLFNYCGEALTGTVLDRPAADGDAPAVNLQFAYNSDNIVVGAVGSTGTPGAGEVLVDFSTIPNYDAGGATAVIVQLSQSYDPGISFFKGPWRQTFVYATNGIDAPPSGAETYTIQAGPPPVGGRMWMRVRWRDAPGRWSPPTVLQMAAIATTP